MTHDPASHKVLVSNDTITVTEITFMPGKPTIMHTHPAHYIYALTDGTFEVTTAAGEVIKLDLKKGDNQFSKPEGLHSTVNTGRTDAKILLVELNEYPFVGNH